MENMTPQQKIASLTRQKAYAWAKYFEEVNNELEMYIVQYDMNERIVESRTDDGEKALPPCLLGEIGEMMEKLKKEIECPICLNRLSRETLAITTCGHKYCKECFERLEQCAICRRKLKRS